MCMEDIRVMRQTQAVQHSIVIATSYVLVASAAPGRVTIGFSAPDGVQLHLNLSPNDPGSGPFIVPSGQGPMIFDIQRHGALVTQEWYAKLSSGQQTFCILETYLS